jgi:nucleoid-associated protein YgaU
MPHATGTITYVVKRGDTLSAIAAWFSLHGYGELYAANMSVIGSNPNLIFPGEHITISHGVLKTSGTRK